MSRQSVKSVDFSSDDKRILFTVKDRSVITRACVHEGMWEGVRRGYSIHFTYDKEAPEGQKIVWGVCFKSKPKRRGGFANRQWHQGTAPMVSDAMACVEQKVANRALDTRLNNLAKLEAE